MCERGLGGGGQEGVRVVAVLCLEGGGSGGPVRHVHGQGGLVHLQLGGGGWVVGWQAVVVIIVV